MNKLQRTGTTEIPYPNRDDWESVRHWRKTKRDLLIQARIGIGKQQRKRCLQEIQVKIMQNLTSLSSGTIGFYWPMKGEFDLRSLVADCLEQGWRAALPVVVEVGAPLEFREWKPDAKLIPGVWNIPVPQERNIVTPTVLLVPLVGFDNENYRLGYGGGYYDRTLAIPDKRPVTIGIGLENCRLDTIYPQWHDIAMDRIVTV